MELLPWIQKNRLCTTQLNLNPNAMEYMIKNNIYMSPHLISLNTSAIDYIIQNPELFKLTAIISNKNAIKLIEKHIHEIGHYQTHMLYSNPNTLHLVCLNPEYIAWNYLSCNTNPIAIKLLSENINKINWCNLSQNESAINILNDNQDKIVWRNLAKNPNAYELIVKHINKFNIIDLSYNTNPLVLKLIEDKLHKLSFWGPLSANPSAIKTLEKNQDKINWYWLSQNPAIFEFNYKKVATKRMNILREDLMMKALHPKRIERWLEQGLDMDDL